MANNEQKKGEVVCVTGANGFIGSWIIRTLLEKQNPHYTSIHATIFPGTDPSHLFTLHPEAKSRITIFPTNILDSTAVLNAITGCSGVFHVASPCTLEDPTDPQKDLIEPAVQGTLNVLEASKRVGVKRVVLTSSISALVPNPNWPEKKTIDESSWTDVEYCASRGKWYPVSKTMAEKAAWEFKEKNGEGLDIVTIHPATCLGPLLQSELNASSAVLQRLMMGSKDTQECYWLGGVHVKDVARAHVLVYETPTAAGRYLCTNGIYQFSSFATIVSELYPDFPIHRFINWRADRSVIWDPYTCKSYQCLVDRKNDPGSHDCKDCFDLQSNEKIKWIFDDGGLDFGIDQVLATKAAGTIRIGLDIGGGTGTFAARMKERNVTIITSTLNLDGPFNNMIASRGLIPMHISISQRFPFFENTLDIVHSMHVMGNWMPDTVLEFVLYDIYRMLRPGGLFWLDHFFCFGSQVNKTYVPMLDRVGFNKLRWHVGMEVNHVVHKNVWYISALMEKPMI